MNITLHLPTAAITVAIGSLALFGMSASAPQSTQPDRDVQAFEDVSGPSAGELVFLHTGNSVAPATYNVPPNKTLVLTGIIKRRDGYPVSITIDGSSMALAEGTDASISFHSGIPVQSGSTIQISSSFDALVTGFLADA